jgi:hypothetical protein
VQVAVAVESTFHRELLLAVQEVLAEVELEDGQTERALSEQPQLMEPQILVVVVEVTEPLTPMQVLAAPA